MAKRERIAINFAMDRNWAGGTYYILNLISALNTLPDHRKPFVTVLVDNNDVDFTAVYDTAYPYLFLRKIEYRYNLLERMVNFFSRLTIRKNIIRKIHTVKDFKSVFPVFTNEHLFSDSIEKIFWFADFQHYHYPNFFSDKELTGRKAFEQRVVACSAKIILSSNDAFNDFKRIYPKAKNSVFVLNFAVTHPDFSQIETKYIVQKFGLTEKYFFCPNQFWQHKNHQLVLDALLICKNKGLSPLIVFSGKESDYRNPEYTSNLKNFVDRNNLADNVRFLGFIDRREQLKIMSESIAVIQPSLFEGWSTVVEDAKAINKYILLSDLNVHKEQAVMNVDFFNPLKADELAKLIMKYHTTAPIELFEDYDIYRMKFAENFIQTIHS